MGPRAPFQGCIIFLGYPGQRCPYGAFSPWATGPYPHSGVLFIYAIVSERATPLVMQLTKLQKITLFILSCLIVSFGQPVWNLFASFLSSTIGFALFFRVLLSYDSPQRRFWLATAWFTIVQLVQLSWFLSHPYLYIVVIHFLVSVGFGIQFGILGLFVVPQKITTWTRMILMTSCWTVLEWSRLFVLSGFAFNPIGLSLSAFLYSLQTASLWGAFGMSFWVLLVNLLALKAWLEWPRYPSSIVWIACAIFPFIFGFVHLKIYDKDSTKATFNTVLIQPVFPIEESMKFHDAASFTKFVESEWKQILLLSKEHLGKKIHLIALPEFIVPFGTYTPIFSYEEVKNTFLEVFGEKAKNALPIPQEPLASEYIISKGSVWMVSNAYWLQGLANIFNTSVVAGMEDAEDFLDGHREFYSSAQYVKPMSGQRLQSFQRYDKRILVPMGEYIPFSFCRNLAAAYGIHGSFTPGQEAKVFSGEVPFGVSICYEETFGHLMRENRLKGAELLVNLTSDAWYPTLAQQHCDHARLRSVENGIPLIRACNTGITCGFDSFGRVIKVLGNTPHEKIWKPGALYLKVPIFSYPTLYSILGDYFILVISFLGMVWGIGSQFIRKD